MPILSFLKTLLSRLPRRRLATTGLLVALIIVIIPVFLLFKNRWQIGADLAKKGGSSGSLDIPRFYGKLATKNNKPFSGTIYLSSDKGLLYSHTNDKGYFAFYDIDPGQYVYSIRDDRRVVWGSKKISEPMVDVPEGDNAFERLEILDLENMGLDWTVKDFSDNWRHADLDKLKNALITYYDLKKSYPKTDGWIEIADTATAEEFLVETILKEKLIDVLPCDPIACSTTGDKYMYYRDDSCGGSDKTISLYAKLQNPTEEDKKTVTDASAKCNASVPAKYGMNYRVGFSIDDIRQSNIDIIQRALSAYYQAKGKYPDTGGARQPNGAWSSSNDASWAKIEKELKPYLPNGVLPKDPINTSGKWAGGGGYNYNYFSRGYGKSGACQWYMLVYKLEDGLTVKSPGIAACSGKKFNYGGTVTEGEVKKK